MDFENLGGMHIFTYQSMMVDYFWNGYILMKGWRHNHLL